MTVKIIVHKDSDNTYLKSLAQALGDLGIEVIWVQPKVSNIPSLFDSGDVLHFHWIEPLVLRSVAWKSWLLLVIWSLTLMGLRLRSRRICITVHNISPHDRSQSLVYDLMLWIILHLSHRAICFTPEQVLVLKARFPRLTDSTMVVIPHGYYPLPPLPGPHQARQSMGLPRELPVVTYLGTLRPYKGVETLLTAMMNISSPCALVLSGWGEPDYLNQVKNLLSGLPKNVRVVYKPGSQSLEFLTSAMAAAHVIVLPFHKVFNSGSLWLALSSKKPCIVSDQPTLKMLLRSTNVSRFTPQDSQQLADLISEALHVSPQQVKLRGIQAWQAVAQYSPEYVANLHKRVYESL